MVFESVLVFLKSTCQLQIAAGDRAKGEATAPCCATEHLLRHKHTAARPHGVEVVCVEGTGGIIK